MSHPTVYDGGNESRNFRRKNEEGRKGGIWETNIEQRKRRRRVKPRRADPDQNAGASSGGKPPHSKVRYHPKVVVEIPTTALVTEGGLGLCS
jgi:hypothetical protein